MGTRIPLALVAGAGAGFGYTCPELPVGDFHVFGLAGPSAVPAKISDIIRRLGRQVSGYTTLQPMTPVGGDAFIVSDATAAESY